MALDFFGWDGNNFIMELTEVVAEDEANSGNSGGSTYKLVKNMNFIRYIMVSDIQ